MKKLFVMILTLVLIFTNMSVASATSSDSSRETNESIDAILSKLNAEYGTNFHLLSAEEMESYGIQEMKTDVALTFDELLSFENTLRYIAEVKIPEFNRITQEAISIIGSFDQENNSSCNDISRNYIHATQEIQYATAGVFGGTYINNYNHTLWDYCENPYCLANMYNPIWFLTLPSASIVDGGRSIFWQGTGDYIGYINGKQVYLYSGTQYAYMNINDWV